VAEVVDVVRGLGEVGLGDLAVGEVGVRLVHAGVDDRDLDALAGVPGVPGRGRTDLRDTVVQQGFPLAVEPDLADTAGPREVLPRLALGRLVGVAVDARQRATRGGDAVRALTGDDQRHGGALVVPVLPQRLQVEQPPVDAPLPDRGDRVGGDHVLVVGGLPHRELHTVATRPRPDRLRFSPLENDLVTRDESDRRCWPACLPRLLLCGRGGSGGDHQPHHDDADSDSSHPRHLRGCARRGARQRSWRYA
jgi:hypothetical protein